jgi:hypothetical protein
MMAYKAWEAIMESDRLVTPSDAIGNRSTRGSIHATCGRANVNDSDSQVLFL